MLLLRLHPRSRNRPNVAGGLGTLRGDDPQTRDRRFEHDELDDLARWSPRRKRGHLLIWAHPLMAMRKRIIVVGPT